MFNHFVEIQPYFPHIADYTIRYDCPDSSLFMTTTALLYNRIENFKINCVQFSRPTDADSITPKPGAYSFYMFENTKEAPDNILKSVKDKFHKIEKLPTHEKFLSEQLKQPVFIRLMPNENVVCIFVTSLTYVVWHCIQFFIPKFFPIFKEKPLTKEEIHFLESLTSKSQTDYVARLAEITNNDAFKSFTLKCKLGSFEKKMWNVKIDKAKQELNRLETQMEKALMTYREACEKRINAAAIVDGLTMCMSKVDEQTELQEYLIHNKNILNLNLDGSNIEFIVTTYLCPHHMEEWGVLSNRMSYFSQFATSRFTENDVKLLLDAIFSENRSLKLKMCAFFRMDYFGSSVNSQRNYNYPEANPILKDYIPNPHLFIHNCFGQNATVILEQLASGEAVGAIECAIACAQKINIHESMTFSPFVRSLLAFTGKCLVAEDGTEMTPAQAINYLKGKTNE